MSLALIGVVSIMFPVITSEAITPNIITNPLYDYATPFLDKGRVEVTLVTDSMIPVSSQTGIDLLFPQSRLSNEYEQQIVADLMSEFFE